ncbi:MULTISPECIES: NCS2 family permease [unclassified Beijerinckia]|uniref:NCS2 family permease n=1 Tax=unclassified Beijerinckia TaxID=2638183 RepID=UPI00089CD151|nr:MULTISPECIES: NCS2 family permease [unclassified Beijerinckia]MDH7798322.1 AGZA family xanthine/uracil permease-like MFS transporter [Beijerinckia sp. GAS462]SED16988.1 putative MFS transporter, AGZA family, xanthine/uracil permease [Beijerinckia sp. 28-YEA-48]
MLNDFFKLEANGTSVRTEVIAGITTFLTMAYIIFVNPSILSQTGMDFGAVFVATCLAAAFGSAFMGLFANYPIALAPGMGLNAYFTFVVVKKMGFAWETALGAVFISGLIFFLISAVKLREWIVNAIPLSLKLGIAAGIGLFLGIIALENAKIIVGNPATLVSLGDVTTLPVLLATIGFVLIAALSARKVTGAIIISILLVTIAAALLGLTEFKGIASMPPSMAPVFLKMDIRGAFEVGLWTIVFVFLFVDMFDNTGTLIGVAHRGGFLDKDGKLPRIGRALMVDSTSAAVGAALGTSTTTSYIESAAGVDAGGRTGLTAVVVAICFLLAVFFAPLAGTVPAFATAPALLYVACLMTRSLKDLDWEDTTEFVPAIVTAITMPLTYSIADGLGIGFIVYTAIKILSGRWSDLNLAVPLIAIAFLVKLVVG